VSGLMAGNHTLRLVDANACEKTYGFVINNAPEILINTTSQTPANCGLADGAVSIGVSGGTGSYSYSYTWRNSSNAVVGGNSNTLSSVRSGAYSVVVKDANNCEKSYVAVVPSVDGPQGTVSVVQTVSCFGGNDGVASISITGGQAPYSILWANNQTSSGVMGSVSMSGLKAGSQLAQITDNRGCVEAVVFSISEPTPLTAQIVSSTMPTCFGGSDGNLEVVATGGTAPYSYLWLDDNSTLTTRSGLKKGTYQVKIKDAKNCEITQSIVLSEPAPVTASFSDNNFTICPNQVLSLDAGNAGSNYIWKKVEGNTTVSTRQQALLTEAGEYELTITTPQGCVGNKTFSVNISNDALKAEFLAATDIEVGDTLVAVDVTSPAPSEVVWSYDVSNPAIRRVDDESIPYYAYFIFDAPGTYVVTMQVKLYGCASTLQKTITVLPKTGRVAQAGLGYQGTGEINKLLTYPNPSGGVFSVKVELVEKAPIEVLLYGLQNRESYLRETRSGAKEYEVGVSLPYLPAGNYILVVKTPQMTKTQTIVISR
jgi:SprB repeat